MKELKREMETITFEQFDENDQHLDSNDLQCQRVPQQVFQQGHGSEFQDSSLVLNNLDSYLNSIKFIKNFNLNEFKWRAFKRVYSIQEEVFSQRKQCFEQLLKSLEQQEIIKVMLFEGFAQKLQPNHFKVIQAREFWLKILDFINIYKKTSNKDLITLMNQCMLIEVK